MREKALAERISRESDAKVETEERGTDLVANRRNGKKEKREINNKTSPSFPFPFIFPPSASLPALRSKKKKKKKK